MKVVEYWPTFVERDDKPREAQIKKAEDALSVPWLREKGADRVQGDKVFAGNFVVGIINGWVE